MLSIQKHSEGRRLRLFCAKRFGAVAFQALHLGKEDPVCNSACLDVRFSMSAERHLMFHREATGDKPAFHLLTVSLELATLDSKNR
eukprot:s349_g3.t1